MAGCVALISGGVHLFFAPSSFAFRIDCVILNQSRRVCRQTHNLRIGIMVRILKMVEKPFPRLASSWRYLREPYRRLDRLNLAEERAERVEIVMPPMPKQPCRFRRHLPGVRVRQRPPLAHLMANSIDQSGIFWSAMTLQGQASNGAICPFRWKSLGKKYRLLERKSFSLFFQGCCGPSALHLRAKMFPWR